MSSSRRLIISRASNNIGDLFYYFVITIIFYKLNHTPIMLGALSMSYLLPGVTFSYVVNILNRHVRSRRMLIISDLIRAVCIGLMAITCNTVLLLALVFLEQCFSISSSVAFDQYVAYTTKKEELNKVNGSIGFWTNLIRLALVPIYLFISPITGDHFFIVIDMVLTILAIAMICSIPSREGEDEVMDLQTKEEKNSVHFRLSIYHMAIVLFCLMCIERVAIDSYAIAYSNEVWKDGTKIFSYITFVTTLAFLSSSALATKIEIKNILTKKKLLLFSLLFMSLVVIYTVVSNMHIFVAVIGASYFVVNYYQVLMTSSIQSEVPQSTASLMLFLTVFYNTISLSFVILGAVIAEGSSTVLFFRVLLGVLLLCFAVSFVLLGKVEEKKDILHD